MSKLVILESPTKAHTVQGYLGRGYKVVGCGGHVRDLPKSTLGVDIENGFAANYINIRGKSELITQLRRQVRNADFVYLAGDPDREGEAICWQLSIALDCDPAKTKRVTFNEITKKAVLAGMEVPRDIDMQLVNSQQARRILDRIVGYKLSPFLWHTVRSGLSAGRVQSVATRIIVDRENEIRAFVPEEYWKLEADLQNSKGKPFTARFWGIKGQKTDITSKDEADSVYERSQKEEFIVSDVKKSVRTRSPQPPFTTSTLQQDASRRLNFRSSRTMKTAQELYEGVNVGEDGMQGLITYMRTDSLRVSQDALDSVREYIKGEYGEKYLPSSPRIFKVKATAQDAHEAVRPASMKYSPEEIKQYLSADQYKLYKLIWGRFVASQMEAAVYDSVSAELTAGDYNYRATGSTVKFKGYLSVYEETADSEKEKSEKLPELTAGEKAELLQLRREQKFTEPPARYNEASLIKFLEEQGIGRPSTYAQTITTITERGYIAREGKSLLPTELGEITVGLMKEYFPDIIDCKFTAGMESSLDEIANGGESMQGVLSSFWDGFSKSLKEADEKTAEKKKTPEQTDITCELCGATMVVKNGRFGKFAACPNYPKCKNTKRLDRDGKPVDKAAKTPPEPTDMKCELCGGMMVIREGRYGKFYSCENFPRCRNSKPIAQGVSVPCPECGGTVVLKHSKKGAFWSCSNYPKCKFSTSFEPTEEKCPSCGGAMFKKKSGELVCLNKECDKNKK